MTPFLLRHDDGLVVLALLKPGRISDRGLQRHLARVGLTKHVFGVRWLPLAHSASASSWNILLLLRPRYMSHSLKSDWPRTSFLFFQCVAFYAFFLRLVSPFSCTLILAYILLFLHFPITMVITHELRDRGAVNRVSWIVACLLKRCMWGTNAV